MVDRRRVTIVSLAALLGALGVIAAGCGGASAAPKSTTTTTTRGGTFGAGFQAFQACLKQNGITVPQFNRPPAAPPTSPRRRFQRNLTPAQQKAFTTCRAKLPQGGFGFRGRGTRTNNPAFTNYTQCLRKHGVQFGKTSSRSAFAKAQAACRSLLPKG